jgi:hypothetical protein
MDAPRSIEQVVVAATGQSNNGNSQVREVVKNELIPRDKREGMAAFVEGLEEVGKWLKALAVHRRIDHPTQRKL